MKETFTIYQHPTIDMTATQITSYNDEVLEINSEEMNWNASNFRTTINLFLKWFMTDYLLALQERYSYQRQKSNNTCVLQVNDIVLVKAGSSPRLSWKGKVEKFVYGDDSLVPGADVCVYPDNLGKIIVIRWPLQLLVLLEETNMIKNHNEVNEANGRKQTAEKISIT